MSMSMWLQALQMYVALQAVHLDFVHLSFEKYTLPWSNKLAPVHAGCAEYFAVLCACISGRGRCWAKSRIASMMLSKGQMHHHATWAAWFAAAGNLLPHFDLTSPTQTRATQEMAESVIAIQQLFSMYVHLPPGLSFPPGSLSAGCEIGEGVATSWGRFNS